MRLARSFTSPRRVSILLVLLALAVTLLFPGMALPAQAQEPVAARVAMLAPLTLDPQAVTPADTSAQDLIENLFIGLVRHDPYQNAILPALAKEWRVSDDGLTWTFTLREDIPWVQVGPDGAITAVRPVDAEDVRFAARRACDPEPPNPVTHVLYVIEGCRITSSANPLLVDDAFVERELGVRVVDARTVEFRLLFPAPYFPALMALPEFKPVPREAANAGEWTVPGVMYTSGPWTLTARDAALATLVRNPHWPDAPAGNVEQVLVGFAPNMDAMAPSFLAGGVDFARVDIHAATAIAASQPNAVLAVPGQTVILLGFSAELPLTASDALRRGLALGIDRNVLLAALPPGAALPAWRMTPPGALSGPASEMDNRGFAPDAARAALEAAGMPGCSLRETLDLMVSDAPEMVALARAVVESWRANLGCNPAAVRVTPVPQPTIDRVANGTYSTIRRNDPSRPALWLYAYTPDYLDVNAWLGDGVHCLYGYLKHG
ncbi:MAG: hypothetical protein IT323_14700, partial [Anaerolineae bacterium]|nr:hypothetical protein [Anaerolineae bacterium]